MSCLYRTGYYHDVSDEVVCVMTLYVITQFLKYRSGLKPVGSCEPTTYQLY